MAIKCDLCKRTTQTVESAIEAGWLPEYQEAGSEWPTAEPICGLCIEFKCDVDDYGAHLRAGASESRKAQSC